MNGEFGEARQWVEQQIIWWRLGLIIQKENPLQFILYTNMGQSENENRTVVRYADDTVIVRLVQNNENVSSNWHTNTIKTGQFSAVCGFFG